jgi:hypothetical protein
MAIERTHHPEYWRKRAEEMRTKADNCEHEQSRLTLLRAAAAYDRIAERAKRAWTVPELKNRPNAEG